jgi:hypothetical protein
MKCKGAGNRALAVGGRRSRSNSHMTPGSSIIGFCREIHFFVYFAHLDKNIRYVYISILR